MILFTVLVIIICYLVIGYLLSVIDALLEMRMTYKTYKERKSFVKNMKRDDLTLLWIMMFWPIFLILLVFHFICNRLYDLKSYILSQFLGENKCEKCKNRNLTYTICDRCYEYSKFEEE